MIRTLSVAALLGVVGAAGAAADEVVLGDGRTDAGNFVAVGPTRIVLDGQSGVSFFDRDDVALLRDDAGREVDWARLVEGEVDPVAVVQVVGDGVRLRRRDRDVTPSVHGSGAVVWEQDVLRTGPYGRVSLLVPGGGVVTARGDALVRFRDGLPELLEGTLHLEHPSGRAAARAPEGRLEVVEGKVVVEHLQGRSRVTCVGGRAVLVADAGYRVELPRSHALDARAETEQEPASLAASNANAWPLRLEAGDRWISVEPGERLILLGRPREEPTRRTGAAPRPTPEPAPTAAAEPPPPPADEPTPAEPPAAVGRVVRASQSFGLERRGATERQVDQAEAQGFSLWPGDAVATGPRGEVSLEVDGVHVRVLAGSRLTVAPPGGGPPFRLDGRATFETEDRAVVAFPGGELGLVRGAASVEAGPDRATLGLREGTAGLRVGNDVRAELFPDGLVTAIPGEGRATLEVPAGALPVLATLGSLEVRLRPGQRATHSRTGDVQAIALWNGARLELFGSVRGEVTAGAGEIDVLVLHEGGQREGRRFRLREGTYRFAGRGLDVEVISVPEGAALDGGSGGGAAPADPPPPVASRPEPAEPAEPSERAASAASPSPSPGRDRQVLANGAVIETRGWGELVVAGRAGDTVEVEGPEGSLFFGPEVRATLVRERGGDVRLEADDGRYVVWSPGAGAFDLRLGADGLLTVDVERGGARRSVAVEPGCEFDLLLHRSFVRAFVFGQIKYVEAGERVRIAENGRLHLARTGTGRR